MSLDAPDTDPITPEALRRAAERRLSSHATLTHAATPDAYAAQRHELEVHQIELALQMEELGRANAELHRLRDKYQDLYDHAPTGYMTLGAGGLVLEANMTAARQFGVPPGGLAGRRLSMFLNETSRRSFAAFLHSALDSGEARRATIEVPDADGRSAWVQLDAMASVHLGVNEPFVRVAFTDVTELKRAQQHITDLNATLEERVEQRTAQIVQLNQELESFVQSLTHDLQTPLRHATGFARLLSQDTHLDSPDAQRHLGAMLSGVDRMNVLVEALSTYFRLGRARLKFRAVSLERVVAEVRRELQPAVGDRVVEWTQDSLPTVVGDITTLQQVFRSLIDNALKFSAGSPVTRVHILVRDHGSEYAIGVQDNGVGFNVRQKDRLFTIFQRLHSERDFSGLGTGLAHVKRAVSRHGGRVWAESEAGNGSTFWITLPKHTAVT